jgi:hypothetical protein
MEESEHIMFRQLTFRSKARFSQKIYARFKGVYLVIRLGAFPAKKTGL